MNQARRRAGSRSWSTPAHALLALLVMLGGCGTGGPLPLDDPFSWHLRKGTLPHTQFLHQRALEQRPQSGLGAIESSLVDVDWFQGLMVRAGVPPSLLPGDGRKLTPAQAAALLTRLLEVEVPLRDWGPKRMAAHLLVGVVQEGRPVSREELHVRMRRYAGVLVLRPDGYLVSAITGEAIQHAGEVELAGGTLRAEGFEAGPFYGTRGDAYLYPLEDDLRHHPDARVAGSYLPDMGTAGPVVDGLGRAVVDVVDGVVTLVLEPVESLKGLVRLPAAVRTLIEHSPEYWERYRALPHGEQVRQASRLLTTVLLTCGTAGAGSARIASTRSQLGRLGVPVLSLAADGTLALRAIAVPTGQLMTAVGHGASAFYILHMAKGGDGETPSTPGASTKRPSGFRKGTVQEAWDNATESPSGGKSCPTCKKEVTTPPGQGTREKPRDWDVDHQPPWKGRDLSGKTRQEVLDEFNQGTRLECPSCNRSRGATPAEAP